MILPNAPQQRPRATGAVSSRTDSRGRLPAVVGLDCDSCFSCCKTVERRSVIRFETLAL
jgi:hypothetical protein